MNRSSTHLTRLLCSLAVLAGFAAASPASAAEALFNGKNLDGWHSYLINHDAGMTDVWSVRDGLLICTGEPMGYLYTDKAYKNYRLKVEWRWAPGQKPGNSGLFLRLTGRPSFLPRCVEVQLQRGRAGDLYAFAGMPMTGDAARFRTIKHAELGEFVGVSRIAGSEKAPGEWNVAEVVVRGEDITVQINGKLVNEAGGVPAIAGPIGLQSEGGEIHFRTVEVTPLED